MEKWGGRFFYKNSRVYVHAFLMALSRKSARQWQRRKDQVYVPSFLRYSHGNGNAWNGTVICSRESCICPGSGRCASPLRYFFNFQWQWRGKVVSNASSSHFHMFFDAIAMKTELFTLSLKIKGFMYRRCFHGPAVEKTCFYTFLENQWFMYICCFHGPAVKQRLPKRLCTYGWEAKSYLCRSHRHRFLDHSEGK